MKKGLSSIISTVLLVLITVVSIGVVAVVVLNSNQNYLNQISEDTNFIGVDFAISRLSIQNNSNISFLLERKSGGKEISGFYILLKDSNSLTSLVKKYGTTQINETQRIWIYINESDMELKLNGKIIEISIYPLKISEEGREIISKFPDKNSVGGGGGGGGGGSFEIYNIPAKACGDKIDNDADGYIDADDLGCAVNGIYNSFIEDENISKGCNPNPDPNNLVLNGRMECDLDSNGIPDSWITEANDSNHILSWNKEEGNRLLFSEYTGLENSGINSFGWHQRYLNVEEGEIYEFGFNISVEGVLPKLDITTLNIQSDVVGASILMYNETGFLIGSGIYLSEWNVNFTEWDESNWTYRDYAPGGRSEWRNIKSSFKIPKGASRVTINTYTRNIAKTYLDDFYLKKLDEDPTKEWMKAGRLEFLKYNEEDFFPIVAHGTPTRNGVALPAEELKEIGFNTFNCRVNFQDSPCYGYVTKLPNPDWTKDPERTVSYTGKTNAISMINSIKDKNNVLYVWASDEVSCKPADYGAVIPDLGSYGAFWKYSQEQIPGVKLFYNQCGNPAPYTGFAEDWKYYFNISDIIGGTANLGNAYPSKGEIPVMGKIGRNVRQRIQSSYDTGKPVLAFAYGFVVYWWSDWDNYRPERWSLYKFTPVNLNRFQIWDQIINGATGVYWFGFYHDEFGDLGEDPYFERQYEVISNLTRELKSLNGVLIESEFYSNWDVDNENIDGMMKVHNGKIYLLTASTHYENIYNVNFNLDKEILSVKALSEDPDGKFDLNKNRTVGFSGNSFTDDFIGYSQSTYSFTNLTEINSPGYAVHIYEIEYT